MEMNMFSMLGQRGAELRVIGGDQFGKPQLFRKGQKWRCMHRGCTVSLFANAQGTLVVGRPQGLHQRLVDLCLHPHPVPTPSSAVNNVVNVVKRKAMDDTTMKPAINGTQRDPGGTIICS